MTEDTGIYERYARLQARHERLQQYLFVTCAVLLPLAIGFFFYPRTTYQDLSHCDTLKAAAYELRHSATEDPTTADTALAALMTLVAACDSPEPDPEDRDRPVFRER